jgi:hypothetical protein
MGLGELLRNIIFDWNVFSLESKKTAKGEAFVAGLPKDSKAGEDDADDEEEDDDDEEEEEEKGDGDSAEAESGASPEGGDEGEGDDAPADGDDEGKNGEDGEGDGEDSKDGEDGEAGKANPPDLPPTPGDSKPRQPKRAPKKKNASEPKKALVIEQGKAAFTAWVKEAVEMLSSSKKEPFDFKRWVNEGQAILLHVVEQTAVQKVKELTKQAKSAATSQLRAAVAQATSAVKGGAADGEVATTAQLDRALALVHGKLLGAKTRLAAFDARGMVDPLLAQLALLASQLDKSNKASPIHLLENACAGLQVTFRTRRVSCEDAPS